MINDITFLFQGKFTNETIESIIKMKEQAHHLRIVVSCWEEDESHVRENIKLLDNVFFVFNQDPGVIKVDGFKTDNIIRQLLSTQSGLNKIKTKYTVKLRSDITVNISKIIELLTVCNDIVENNNSKIINKKVFVTSLTTLDPKKSGLYFHICDWIYGGETEDIKKLFSIEMPSFDFFHFFESEKESLEICSQYRSESYITLMLIKKYMDIHYPYSGFFSKKLENFSYKILESNFVVVNPWNIGLKSYKHKRCYFWLRSDRYTEISCGAYLKKLNLTRRSKAIIFELVMRGFAYLAEIKSKLIYKKS